MASLILFPYPTYIHHTVYMLRYLLSWTLSVHLAKLSVKECDFYFSLSFCFSATYFKHGIAVALCFDAASSARWLPMAASRTRTRKQWIGQRCAKIYRHYHRLFVKVSAVMNSSAPPYLHGLILATSRHRTSNDSRIDYQRQPTTNQQYVEIRVKKIWFALSSGSFPWWVCAERTEVGSDSDWWLLLLRLPPQADDHFRFGAMNDCAKVKQREKRKTNEKNGIRIQSHKSNKLKWKLSYRFSLSSSVNLCAP